MQCRQRVQALIDAACADLMLLQEFVPGRLQIDPAEYELRTWRSGAEIGAIVARTSRTGRMARGRLATMSIGEPTGRAALAVYLPKLRTVVASIHAGHDRDARDRDLVDFTRRVDATARRRRLEVAAVVAGGDFNGVCTVRLDCCGHVLHAPADWPITCCRKDVLVVRDEDARTCVVPQQSSDAILSSDAAPPQIGLSWAASDHDPVIGVVGGTTASRQAALVRWLDAIRTRGIRES